MRKSQVQVVVWKCVALAFFAIRLAMEKLLVPELKHLRKQSNLHVTG